MRTILTNLPIEGAERKVRTAISGHKTMSVFKRYNLVTEEELQDVKWEKKKGTIDTNMDTKAEVE